MKEDKKHRRKNDILLKGAVEKEIAKLFERKTGIMAAIREQILEEGIELGIQQSEARGRRNKALEIALELKKEGLTIDFIAKTTKLTAKEIEALV